MTDIFFTLIGPSGSLGTPVTIWLKYTFLRRTKQVYYHTCPSLIKHLFARQKSLLDFCLCEWLTMIYPHRLAVVLGWSWTKHLHNDGRVLYHDQYLNLRQYMAHIPVKAELFVILSRFWTITKITQYAINILGSSATPAQNLKIKKLLADKNVTVYQKTMRYLRGSNSVSRFGKI